MKDVFLIRFAEGDYGTQGMWLTPGFQARTIELPWKDNKSNISCIPDGKYKCKIRKSPKYGNCYHVTNVQGRSWILTHRGNWAGDRSKGMRSNSNGCIIMGKYHARICGQIGVGVSRPTVRRFTEFMEGEEFNLYVQSAHRGIS